MPIYNDKNETLGYRVNLVGTAESLGLKANSHQFLKNSISFCVALPRWLIAFFSSAGISAKVSSEPSGRKIGS